MPLYVRESSENCLELGNMSNYIISSFLMVYSERKDLLPFLGYDHLLICCGSHHQLVSIRFLCILSETSNSEFCILLGVFSGDSVLFMNVFYT